ncbi:hypothetical protein LWS67_13170 [Bacillus atrophaeus]|uniref:hypothetical protein n=1 Tax=Bacillus atrophaeus TaxID=1452 RepID=UPI001EFB21DB|nr:hypothetical protein [Bacillus atrophaeus]MCG8397484.1 hypothetical protein [Bacillus atrophaeus]
MKKLRKIFYCNAVLMLLVLLLVGCMGGKEEKSNNDPSLQSEENNNETETETEDNNQISKDESQKTSSEEIRDEEKSQKDNVLAEYLSEKIEYARVWLQLGANQEIDELNVRHISAGEPINPNDDTSANYPEDVIQLSGSRLVDGSVTYSDNGDGTIKVYNVPLRWDSSDDVSKGIMREVTENIIKNTKTVYVDTGDSEKIKRLIDIMAIH